MKAKNVSISVSIPEIFNSEFLRTFSKNLDRQMAEADTSTGLKLRVIGFHAASDGESNSYQGT